MDMNVRNRDQRDFLTDKLIQVRLTIYITSIAGPILSAALQCESLDKTVNYSLVVQGSALASTTVFYASKGQLTLFHALCISHLMLLSTLGLFPCLDLHGQGARMKVHHPVRFRTHQILSMFCWLHIWAVVTYVWMSAPTFGSLPNCNHETIFVLFGADIMATRPTLRWTMVALCLSVICFSAGLCALSCCCNRMRRRRRTRLPSGSLTGVADQEAVVASTAPAMGAHFDSDPPLNGHALRQLWLYTIARNMVGAYLITTLELMIKRNNVAVAENRFSFGQVFVVYTLSGPVSDLCLHASTFVDKWRGKNNALIHDQKPEPGSCSTVIGGVPTK